MVAGVAAQSLRLSLAAVAVLELAAQAQLGPLQAALVASRLLQQTAQAGKASPGLLRYRPRGMLNTAVAQALALLQLRSLRLSVGRRFVAAVVVVLVARTLLPLQTSRGALAGAQEPIRQAAAVQSVRMAQRLRLARLARLRLPRLVATAVAVAELRSLPQRLALRVGPVARAVAVAAVAAQA